MPYQPKILVLAGSLRQGSSNKKLARLAVTAAQSLGAFVTYVDLKEYPMPIYDGDIEASEGLPANAKKLKELLWQHDGFIFASPEYNSSISAVLKNFIDWTSRQGSKEEIFLSCFIGKIVLLVSASPSPLGGLRGLVHLRSILANIYSIVIPEQKVIPNSLQAFDENGKLLNPKDQTDIESYVKKLVEMVTKIQGK